MILPMILLAAGCETPSIRPLATKDKRISDAALVGTWQSDGDTYTIRAEGDHYVIVFEDDEKQIDHKWNLEVRPIQLGKHRLDIQVAEKEQAAVEERWGPLFVPTHLFVRYTVDAAAGSLKFWALAADRLSRQALRRGHISFGDYLITSDTLDLQAFLEVHAGDAHAFRLEEFKRVEP
jgi:hypothetical protein